MRAIDEDSADDFSHGGGAWTRIIHSPISLKSLKIEGLDDKREVIGTATGFLFTETSTWQDLTLSEISLVTNYHVASGQDTRSN